MSLLNIKSQNMSTHISLRHGKNVGATPIPMESGFIRLEGGAADHGMPFLELWVLVYAPERWLP